MQPESFMKQLGTQNRSAKFTDTNVILCVKLFHRTKYREINNTEIKGFEISFFLRF